MAGLPISPTDDLPCRIHRLYQRLATAASLEPCDEINGLFSELVRLSLTGSEPEATRVLGDPIVSAIQENLQGVCAQGECALERHWAERVEAAGHSAWDELRRFPYYGNYEKLARLEWHALASLLPEQPGRILFIGSGPLPLTSILFAAMYGIRIDNVDVDPQACAAGRALAERLGLVNKLRFLHADGAQFADMGAHEVVFIAALVGLRRAEKQRIIRNVARHGRADAMLVVRSAHRLRALLYPEIKAAQMAPFIPLLEIHPHHDVINSVVVAGRPAVPAHPPAWSGLPVVADVEAF